MRTILLLLTLHSLAFTPPPRMDKPAYRLYSGKLKSTSYEKLLKQAAEADVVLFGELHNNPICHWLQLQLAKDLLRLKGKNLSLGAEMFETDNQPALSDYLSGKLTDEAFRKVARLWPNYPTDYRPLVELAKQHALPFAATNVPRRYASMVAKQGLAALDTLPTSEKQWIAPLPVEVDLTLPGYKAMLSMGHSAHGRTADRSGPVPEGMANFARAQAIKDATMAHRIAQDLQPGATLLHLNGDYHSKKREGIVWYLNRYRPGLRILTISTLEAADVARPDRSAENLADFILLVPDDMTKTY
mgnify:CR=1 FL=1